MTKPRETFHFNPPVEVKEDWMIGLTDLEVHNSVFNVSEEYNKFKFSEFPENEKSGGVSCEKVRDEIEKDFDFSDITATDLKDDIIAPIIINEHREQVTKRMKDNKYMLVLAMYIDSVFQDFERFLRTEVDWVEDDFRLVLDYYNSSYITDELEPGIYTFKDISEVLFKILHPECRVYNASVDIRNC